MSRRLYSTKPYSTSGKGYGPYTNTGPTEPKKPLERLSKDAQNKRIAQLAEDRDGISVLEKLSAAHAGNLIKRPPRRPVRLDDNEYLRKRMDELERQKKELLTKGAE